MQIRLGCSKSEIHGCPDNLMPALFKQFTYVNKSVSYRYSQHMKGKFRFINGLMHKEFISESEATERYEQTLRQLELAKRVCLIGVKNDIITFPTGLLQKISQFFTKHVSNFSSRNIVDVRSKPVIKTKYAVHSDPVKLWPFQQEALDKCLVEHQGTVDAGTGLGKTVIIQEIIRNIGLKAVLITPSLSIMNQTVKRFQKYFGKGKVGAYGGGKKQIRNITIACAPSMIKSDPSEWTDVDVLLLDECHHSPASTIESICYNIVPNAYFRFGFTATNYRADGADLAIEAAVFPTVFRYTLEQGIAGGFLAKPLFFMFNVDFSTRRYGGSNVLFAYKNHVMKNYALNKIVIDQIKGFLDDNKKVLVLVKEKEHGNIIQEQIPQAAFVRNRESKSVSHYVAPLVDADKAVKEFNDGKLNCLIGTSIIGEGTDIVPVDVLFLLTGGMSKVSVLQSIGRGLRSCEGKKGVLIIDYIYGTHSLLSKHSLLRHKYYKEIGETHVFNLHRDGTASEVK